jgi:hypothetical protein
MHFSDVIIECSEECARLSQECPDEKIAAAFIQISARLRRAATDDAELVMDDTPAAPRSALYVVCSAGG